MKRTTHPVPIRTQFTRARRFVRVGPGLLLAVAVALYWPQNAPAVGFRLPNQDPQGIARGNAFVATADNPAAIYYNPAGITQLNGQNFQAGIYFVNANTDYESPTGQRANNKYEFQPVPEFYYTYSPKQLPLSFGLGVYAPYGLALKYPEDSPFRTLAIDGKLLYVTLNPVMAWKIHPKLSVAIGPTLNGAQAEFKRGIVLPGDGFKFKGSGFDAGFNGGIRWQPHEQWAFGASYRYSTSVDFSGHSEAYPYAPRSSTKAEIRFPQFIVAGVSFRPTGKWNLEFNVDWTDWDNVNEIIFRGTSAGDQVFPLHWTSSFMYEFGVTRYLAKGYLASVGYFFSENSSPDRTFNPIVPDANLHLGSIGIGHQGKRWDWNLAYHFALGGRTVEGNISPFANGTYHMFNQAVNVSARLKF